MGSSGIATILIIEDESAFRCFYRDMLDMAGYQVLEAEDGEAGWALVQSAKPDMILLDLIMPKLGGLEVLKKIRGNDETKDIPVIIMSAVGRLEDMRKGIELGANEYLQKGLFSSRQALAKIRAVFEEVEQKMEVAAYRLSIKEARTSATRLKAYTGMTELFICPYCKGEVILSLIPDLTKPEKHWFSAYFVCSKCDRSF
jgi:two-component system phosphate regulon response regulator PhoB